MNYADLKDIKVEKANGIATVTLNRPETLNAFNYSLHVELESVWERMAQDSDVRAVVLTGAGRAFSSGGDIRAMEETLTNPNIPQLGIENARRIIMNMLSVQQPIIGAINGDAVGLGATVALFCDVIVASEKARFGDPHVRVGLVAGDGGAVIWPLLIGVAKAKEFLMTGDLISAAEAERIGLVNRVVPQEQVMSAALETAKRLASGAVKAIQWTKVSVNKLVAERVNLILDTSLALEFNSMKLDDHKEAVRAFLEKRSPKFTGK